MKVLIEIDDNVFIDLLAKNFIDCPAILKAVQNGTPLNGTNGEVLMKMFPPSVYFPSEGKYMALLTKNCIVSCSNVDWWNAEYKTESEVK